MNEKRAEGGLGLEEANVATSSALFCKLTPPPSSLLKRGYESSWVVVELYSALIFFDNSAVGHVVAEPGAAFGDQAV